MKGRPWKTLLAAGCFAACVLRAGVLAQTDAPGTELLRRLPTAPDPARTVTVTYEVTNTSSKEKDTEEQVTARLATPRAQIDH